LDILKTISDRISVRSYEPEPAAATELGEVRRAGEVAEALTHVEMQFHLRTHDEMGKEVKGLIGDYGKTIRAPHYIVLTSREGEGYLTDAGFRFEQMILEATQRGLGTCWVGLLFKEASLRSCLGLDDSWRVIALTPIGRPAGPTFISRALRSMARSATRKPIEQIFFWQRHGSALPFHVFTDDRLTRIMEATRWAPSWMNKQPWYFILTPRPPERSGCGMSPCSKEPPVTTGGAPPAWDVLVYKKRPHNREGKDYHLLDCGIAMAHLHLAAKALGFSGQWELGTFEVPGAPDAQPIGRYPLMIEGSY
jgi:nitroreductase